MNNKEEKENIKNQNLETSMFDVDVSDDGLDEFNFDETTTTQNTSENNNKDTEAEIVAENEIENEEFKNIDNANEITIEKEAEIDKNAQENEFMDETPKNIAINNSSINNSSINNTQQITDFKKDNYVSTSDFEEEIPEENKLITVRPIKFQEFEDVPPNRAIKRNLDILQDVNMHISVELGRTKSTIRDVMELEKGSIVELDKIAGEQVEVFVNKKLVAKGEVIVIEDKFGVRVTSTNIAKNI